jgi:carbamoyl-phosphate synthase large subunit
MPKRTDIQTIAIIGAGPIIIGQACEFDYSGAQACKALRDEGYRVVLINSNPATIMTDPNMADATYIEPITPETVAKILRKERPQALLPTMGGQTALNTALKLADMGVLDELGIELIGANREAINKAEDRQLFKDAMLKIGLDCPKSRVVHNFDEALLALPDIGLPAIIRPSFTLGGTGGGIAYNRDEFETIVRGGLAASPTTEVLIEESVLGWKEYEMEVVRDKADNAIIVCSIENLDPMGVHTGDSITVAPALTLTDKEYQIMRNASLACLREIGVETGGSNVQFAINPKTGRMIVIEMNPRVSRSSALASKATGFPIAKIAAKLAVGYTLDELKNDITKTTPASFEPSIDYVVTKIPRFAFEKLRGSDSSLTTQMKSVGEVMAIGRNFQESMQKALRGMEKSLAGFDEQPWLPETREGLIAVVAKATPQRILAVAEAFRRGMTVAEIHAASAIDPWFLEQIKQIVDTENSLLPVRAERIRSGWPVGPDEGDDATKGPSFKSPLTPGSAGPSPYRERGNILKDADEMRAIKRMGFSDARIAKLISKTEKQVRDARQKLGVRPAFRRIDTCAAEFPASTNYFYSSYENPSFGVSACEANPSANKKIAILGGGPNRIGQGIEFDYCCVHAAYALREAGVETIMINCNPETVSTDYDTSDRLYFEPLTAEDVIEVLQREASNGELLGVIVQYGGQTPLKLAHDLEQAGIKILGTSVDMIDLAEDRERFQKLVHKLGLKQPANGLARSVEEARRVAASVGYPLVLRPSYVLGGAGMEIITDDGGLERYITSAIKISGDSPLLLDSFLLDAGEVDVDAISDGETVFIAGIMEHVEEAGVHSGDSSCALPPYSLSENIQEEIRRQTRLLAKALNVVGLMNIQFAIKDDEVYLLEVNPRASRTVPFVAKATGIEVAKIGARVMAGEKLAAFNLVESHPKHTAVKAPVFPFNKFPGVDILLSPEMKSTGEVMGIDAEFPLAYVKAMMGAGYVLPTQGTAFISLKERDKVLCLPIAKKLFDLGFKLVATDGTAKFLADNGLKVERINKVYQGQPHIVDAMINREIQLVINTVEGAQATADSFSLRRMALTHSIPHYTTLSGARGAVAAIAALQQTGIAALSVERLQNYLAANISAKKQAA